jgi:hypothetical protein
VGPSAKATSFRECCPGKPDSPALTEFHMTKPKSAPPVVDPYRSESGKYAYACRSGATPAELIEAKRRWIVVYLEKQIRNCVASAPTLTAEDRLKLALLFSEPHS